MNEYAGLGGAFVIREVVKTIKPCYAESKFSGLYSALISQAMAIILNIGIALSFGNDIVKAVGIGIATGIIASVWDEVKSL
jgi:hypothetical protein